MKSCPTCNRTYPDDTLAFCLVDGSVLSAAYDPEQTQRIPAKRNTDPPATDLMGGKGTPSRLQATIRAATPDVPPLYVANAAANQSRKRNIVPWLLVSGAILLVGIFGVALVVFNFSSRPSTYPPSPSATPIVAQTNKMCGQNVSAAIVEKWTELGGETGKFGCPINQETDAFASPQGSSGRWIQFAKGDGGYLIEYRSGSRAGKVFEVGGCMFKLYASVGGTKSWLGFPTGDGYETPPGARQEFEGGYVVWDRKTYECQSHKY